jgi:hypothetical protein
LFFPVITDDLLNDLIDVLDEELGRLATLRFQLVVLGSLVAADQAPWLDRSVRELERASEELRLADLRRAAATVGLSDEYDLGAEARLGDIAERADRAWGEILFERRSRLLEEIAGIERLVETTTMALGRRAALVGEAMTFLRTGGTSTYGRRPAGRAQLVQGAL